MKYVVIREVREPSGKFNGEWDKIMKGVAFICK